MVKKLILALFPVLLLFISCKDDEGDGTGSFNIEQLDGALDGLNLPELPDNYSEITFPTHFTTNSYPGNFGFQFAAIESDNTPLDNPTTDEGALLGRVLFYEKKLSANGTISCASCHVQENGFSDSEVLSIGFEGELTRRHSMGLTNARFYDTGKFFWDERAETLEDQVLMPIQDEVEMGTTLDELVRIVEGQPYTAYLFTAAFGDPAVTTDRISKALAQFIRSLVSFNSKYDQGRSMVDSPLDDFPNFTNQENRGKSLFTAQQAMVPACSSCHMSEAFVAPLLAPNASTSGTNNGLDLESTDDLGIFEASGRNNHIGKFKVPSLRNVGVRAPYMHDGRFASLEEVIDHYSNGIQNHPTLQPFLLDANDQPIQFNYTPAQKAALVAFLHTLTDDEFLTAEKFSNPFQ